VFKLFDLCHFYSQVFSRKKGEVFSILILVNPVLWSQNRPPALQCHDLHGELQWDLLRPDLTLPAFLVKKINTNTAIQL